MKLKKIQSKRRRLADEVYDQLIEAIQDQRVDAEDRLVQEKIASDLHISRTPVREALFRLEQEGILMSSPGGGFVIRQVSAAEVTDIYHARVAIEGYAARLLAQINNPTLLAQLRVKVSKLQQRNCTTVKQLFETNRDIHRAFVETTGNAFLIDMFDSLWNRSTSYQVFSDLNVAALADITSHHLPLIDAIESDSADIAMQAFEEHILAGLELQLH